ncbi:MAG: zinc-binding alcohol dehydrogenase [Lentisphaeria bacterium]|nr:zinc-binding alcohol dehydrogenase [Lentisphaeria bacterium]
MDTNKIICFPEPHKTAIETAAIPTPGADELLIKTSRTLISTGTEMTAYCADYEPGSVWEQNFACPFYPGYNNIGTVISAGENVSSDWIGKRVATTKPHAAYVTVTLGGEDGQASGGNGCVVVPDGISDDDAVFFTIPQIVMNGIRLSKIKWGECAVVYGLGLLGQFAVRFLLECGAFPVIAVDTACRRLELLPDNMAVVPVNPLESDVAECIKKHNSGRMADVVIELTGNGDLIPQQARLLRQHGRLVILSSPKKPVLFDFHDDCVWPSISIIGAHNFSHPDFPQPDNPWTKERHIEMFFDLVRLGKLDLAPLVSRKVDYTNAAEAYCNLEHNRGNEMGVIIDWSKA